MSQTEVPERAFREYLRREHGAELTSVAHLGGGWHGQGYRVVYRKAGSDRVAIMKVINPHDFGHDHFSDRAAVVMLAHDTFGSMKRHIPSIDVVGLADGELVSVGRAKEFYHIMEEAHGTPYFDDLDRIEETGRLEDSDLEKCRMLARFLAELHSKKWDDPGIYTRKMRDTVGHGECLMGVIDTYPVGSHMTRETAVDLVSLASESWWKAREVKGRCCSVHGDFHPGNIWWNGGEFTLLDRSRGESGEAADDVVSLLINYLFYGMKGKHGFEEGPFMRLHDAFLNEYLKVSGDQRLTEFMGPFLAFRAVVVAHPVFYPNVSDDVRRRIVQLAIDTMRSGRYACGGFSREA